MKLIDNLFTIIGESEQEATYSCSIRINPEHFIFKAHFPGNPIMPGVCIAQVVQEVLEHKLVRALSVKSVKNIKFLQVIEPQKTPIINVSYPKIAESDGVLSVSAVVSGQDTTFAKLSVIYL